MKVCVVGHWAGCPPVLEQGHVQQVLGRQVGVSLSSPVLHCCQGCQIPILGLELQELTRQSATLVMLKATAARATLLDRTHWAAHSQFLCHARLRGNMCQAPVKQVERLCISPR